MLLDPNPNPKIRERKEFASSFILSSHTLSSDNNDWGVFWASRLLLESWGAEREKKEIHNERAGEGGRLCIYFHLSCMCFYTIVLSWLEFDCPLKFRYKIKIKESNTVLLVFLSKISRISLLYTDIFFQIIFPNHWHVWKVIVLEERKSRNKKLWILCFVARVMPPLVFHFLREIFIFICHRILPSWTNPPLSQRVWILAHI